MEIVRRASTAQELFVLKDGPTYDYMSPKGTHASMRVRQVEFRFISGRLTGIAITGIRLRDDGTEITWEKPTYVIEAKWADTTPLWVAELMALHGIFWSEKKN